MGWWQISKNMANGDGPADHMDEALAKIVQEYKNAWGREPYKEEITAVFQFCTAGDRFASSGEKLEHGPGICGFS